MPTGTVTQDAECGGAKKTNKITKTFDHPNNYEAVALGAGKAVTDWAKTDADEAGCNLPADHGFSTGKFHVAWTGGVRYYVDGTVTVNALALAGGTGDDFPESEATDVIVSAVHQINTAIDGDAVVMFHATATGRVGLHFLDAAAAEVASVEILDADTPFEWHDTCQHTNPFTGNPITVCYAASLTASAATLDILSGVDSTP